MNEKELERVLDTLSKMMIDTKDSEDENRKAEKIYDNIYGKINGEYYAALTKMPSKENYKIIDNVKNLLKCMELLLKFPKLKYKNIIGIKCSDKKIYKDELSKLTDKLNGPYYNGNVPIILYGSETDEAYAININGNKFEFSIDNIVSANQSLKGANIAEEKIIDMYCVGTKLRSKNIAYIIYPVNKDINSERLSYLDMLVDIYAVDENLINDDGLKDKTVIKVGADSYDKYDYAVDNIHVSEYFKYVTASTIFKLTEKIKYNKDLIGKINTDMIFKGTTDSEDVLQNIKSDIGAEQKKYEELLKQINSVVNEISGDFLEYEETISTSQANFTHTHFDLDEIYAELFMLAISEKRIDVAKEYQEKSKAINSSYSYIFPLFFMKKEMINSTELSKKILMQLKSDGRTNKRLNKIKLELKDELKLSEDEMYKAALCIDELQTANEYLAMSYGTTSEKDKKQYLMTAVGMGNQVAGEILFSTYDLSDDDMYTLAMQMNGQACYIISQKDKYKSESKIFLNMSAALEYPKAIKAVTHRQYSEFNKMKKDEKKTFGPGLINMYEKIIDMGYTEEDVYFELGTIYYEIGNYKMALDTYKTCTGKGEAMYIVGCMYRDGKGTAQNENSALKYLKKASDMDYNKGMVDYEKLKGKIAEREEKEKFDAQKDYSSYSTTSNSSYSGGCFITTAACTALNKPDDCEELLAFKAYRDNHLVYETDGRKLIREYYRIAPGIVRIIDGMEKSLEFYQNLWEQYIIVGYKYLQENNLAKAKETYINMVLHLCNLFDIQTEV